MMLIHSETCECECVVWKVSSPFHSPKLRKLISVLGCFLHCVSSWAFAMVDLSLHSLRI
jgi:hypothetical protein